MVCDVVPASQAAREAARVVACELDLTLALSYGEARSPVVLVVDTHEAWLQKLVAPRPGPVVVDFSAPDMLYRRKSGHNEPLGRAIGIKGDRRPRVFDATAGLGRDAFVLADLGCDIELFEVSPVLVFLLRQARDLALLSVNTKVAEAARRMTVSQGDSRVHTVEAADVIYLDPMFPASGKTAAVKKDLATLQALHVDNSDDGGVALLAWALGQSVSRVVVKRPAKADCLAGAKPSHAIQGKTVRFDVFIR